ncbi:MAG: DHH family phosphoesterase [Bacilli bacterium]|nr:DHH family phosphoesterase [Bacilli bacterium]
MRKIITSYINPDMDGIALMYAYCEYLRKKGEDAYYYFEGTYKKEVGIVLDTFNISLNPIDKVLDDDKIILVDTNYIQEIPNTITENKIVEVIDHHKREQWIDEYNVKAQIEPLGSASTIVAERFKNSNLEISKESAILLYYGIISNTMNLKIKLTNQRDIDMANWLKSLVPEITDSITNEIFVKKSEIGNNLREEMEVEFKDQFMTISWSMGQLEVANVEDFLEKYEDSIRNVLETVSKEKEVEYMSVNCMDIINGYSIIVALNDKTANLISKSIGVNFIELKAKINELISRKEIVKVIRNIYSK